MKSTGIKRKVDELGRVVLPVELRNTLDIHPKDQMEIFMENEKIILKKYQDNFACQVTGKISEKNFVLADGKIVLSPESAEELVKEISLSLQKEK
ncbi:AbrB/MazE/SpoVT family DNA-binding domain-containing protein [Oceanobacillus halophilus]|uniref:AbrB/MazE/SpoVT family DNA-binding domain-containing protein n=1 Tax=Oceanobacillus halophilus TaxID=930130 RepID=A0A495A1V1_9BACI|nr:AbrB/MazE/SpoVT family DNA-binding domain-containing protein [Oceanobacillus halophilus]RKQ33015.1 AbrB/MazE/SpoVT family DNA-binding domain-containing protein [Oceanobacillus halophilus]